MVAVEGAAVLLGAAEAAGRLLLDGGLDGVLAQQRDMAAGGQGQCVTLVAEKHAAGLDIFGALLGAVVLKLFELGLVHDVGAVVAHIAVGGVSGTRGGNRGIVSQGDLDPGTGRGGQGRGARGAHAHHLKEVPPAYGLCHVSLASPTRSRCGWC